MNEGRVNRNYPSRGVLGLTRWGGILTVGCLFAWTSAANLIMRSYSATSARSAFVKSRCSLDSMLLVCL